MMITNFTWRGEPILDIRAWARERGEKIVRFHAERMVPSPWTPWGMVKEEYDDEMPESFYDHLAIREGWHYTELERVAL